MSQIIGISVTFRYSSYNKDGDVLKEKLIVLSRDENKEWKVADADIINRGLFPSEIRIANMIQEQIIEKYNG